MEYEFSLATSVKDDIAYFVSSGPPVLRLEGAVIEDNRLICEYAKTFITAGVSQQDDEFVLMLDSANNECPTALKLEIRDRDAEAAGWSVYSPGHVRVDKTHGGHRYVVYNLHIEENEKENTYDGCVYSITLKDDGNFQSNPNLWMNIDGVCRVNDTGDGFICADSIAELYGADNTQATPAESPTIIKK